MKGTQVTPVLDVRGLAKSFTLHGIGGRVVHAFSGVDFTVAPGELVALAGRSGAGKSSVIKAVYRTYRPTAGTVMFAPATGEPVDLAALPDADVADLEFTGFVGFTDPVRAGSQATVRDLRDASVQVVMITGDHPSTAEAVAEELDVSVHQVYALIRRGDLRSMKIGGRGVWRIGRDDLEVYIERAYEETSRWIAEHPFTEDEEEPPPEV